MSSDIHGKIMSLQLNDEDIDTSLIETLTADPDIIAVALLMCKITHRDARHAAAELSLKVEDLAYTKGVVWAISVMLRTPGQTISPADLWNESMIKVDDLQYCDPYDAGPILKMLDKEGE